MELTETDVPEDASYLLHPGFIGSSAYYPDAGLETGRGALQGRQGGLPTQEQLSGCFMARSWMRIRSSWMTSTYGGPMNPSTGPVACAFTKGRRAPWVRAVF